MYIYMYVCIVLTKSYPKKKGIFEKDDVLCALRYLEQVFV